MARIFSEVDRQEEEPGDYPLRLIVKMLYGCGLRVTEPLNLRIKDVDLENSRLTIRDAKGRKDRVVPLPCSLVPALQEQIKKAQKIWMRDRQRGIPVPLPGALDRKYPNAGKTWAWYWLFPAHRPCKHPQTAKMVRWRVHEVNVQRAVREAAKRCGLEAHLTPHVLRHAFATHSLQQGRMYGMCRKSSGMLRLKPPCATCMRLPIGSAVHWTLCQGRSLLRLCRRRLFAAP